MTGIELTLSHPDDDRFDTLLDALVEDRVASRITAHDETLWGPDAESEAAVRLAWTSLHETSRPLIAEIETLRAQFHARGLAHVVLCGMGGSSLAPEVICAASCAEITILDSSDPDQVRAALGDRLESSIVVVSSKSGSTVETDSQKRAFEAALRAAGKDPADHMVIVTDPESPLDESARHDGYRVFNAEPDVGGRYSALTAFGLVPSGLAGAPIGRLLDEAAEAAPLLAADSADNPGLLLGATLGDCATNGADKLVIADATGNGPGTGIGLGNWIEQLIAESTGKQRKGILPVVVPTTSSPNFTPNTADSALASIGSPLAVAPASGHGISVSSALGAQMLLWEYATAVAGRVIGIDPFNQPDVERAKEAARGLLDGGDSTVTPDFSDGEIAVYTSPVLLRDGIATMAGAVEAILELVEADDHSYLSVQAYVDRSATAKMAGVRETLATRLGRPVTFGWGPRFLHSTGQYHKGGPEQGVFLQIVCEPYEDLEIPGRDFTFQEFKRAQATGDAKILAEHGRPVLRLEATGSPAGLRRIRESLS